MATDDPLLRLLARFHEEGVEYVLVGGQAVRLNGYVRATEDLEKDLLDKQVLARIREDLKIDRQANAQGRPPDM